MATSKLLKPTNVTISIPEFTDQPDQRVNSNCIDKEADAINTLSDQIASIRVPQLLLEEYTFGSSDNTYDCNWSAYNLLIIGIGNYGNTYTTISIPTSEFSQTANGHAVFIAYAGGQAWTIYKSSNTKVTIIKPSSVQTATRIRIWGVL